MKKLALILTAVILFCAVFSACGGAAALGETTAETAAESTTTAEATTGTTTADTTGETTAEETFSKTTIETTSETESSVTDAEFTEEPAASEYDWDDLSYVMIYIQYDGGLDLEGYPLRRVIPGTYYQIDDRETVEKLAGYFKESSMEETGLYLRNINLRIQFNNGYTVFMYYDYIMDPTFIHRPCLVRSGDKNIPYEVSEEGLAYLSELVKEIEIIEHSYQYWDE